MVRMTGSGIDVTARDTAAAALAAATAAQAAAAAAIPIPAGATEGQALVLQSGVWIGGTVSGGGGSVAGLDSVRDNQALLGFKLAAHASLTGYALVGGFLDAFTDQAQVASHTGYTFDTQGFYGNLADPYTKYLFNMNGADNGTDFPESVGHVATRCGNLVTKTAQQKWGTASAFVHYPGDHLTLPHHVDNDLSSCGSWTMEGWVYSDDMGVGAPMISKGLGTAYPKWAIYLSPPQGYSNNYGLFFWDAAGNAHGCTDGSGYAGPLYHQWNHWAVTFAADTSTYRYYCRGIRYQEIVINETLPNPETPLRIGGMEQSYGGNGYYLDDVRLRKGICAYTDATITVPFEEFTYAATPNEGAIISTVHTAQTSPGTGRLLLLEEALEARTLNTDLKAWLSRDGGAHRAYVPLVHTGNDVTGQQILAGTVDLSDQPAGVDMVYGIESVNHKANRLHATCLQWG